MLLLRDCLHTSNPKYSHNPPPNKHTPQNFHNNLSSPSLLNLSCNTASPLSAAVSDGGFKCSSAFEDIKSTNKDEVDSTDFFSSKRSDSGLLQEVIHGFFPTVKPPQSPPPTYAPPPIAEVSARNEFVGYPVVDNQRVFAQFGVFNPGGGHYLGVEASSSSHYNYNYCSDFQSGSNGIFGDIFHYQEALGLVEPRVPNA